VSALSSSPRIVSTFSLFSELKNHQPELLLVTGESADAEALDEVDMLRVCCRWYSLETLRKESNEVSIGGELSGSRGEGVRVFRANDAVGIVALGSMRVGGRDRGREGWKCSGSLACGGVCI